MKFAASRTDDRWADRQLARKKVTSWQLVTMWRRFGKSATISRVTCTKIVRTTNSWYDVQITPPRWCNMRWWSGKRIRSGESAAARFQGRNTGVRSPIINANGLRSIMAWVHADARGDAGLHHSLCHHDSCRGIYPFFLFFFLFNCVCSTYLSLSSRFLRCTDPWNFVHIFSHSEWTLNF